MDASQDRKPILISGAGISGLALAQGLLKLNLPFRLFERDHALAVRAQGYRVRIREPGIVALRSLLSPALFAELVASCPEIGPTGAKLDALTARQRSAPFEFQALPEEQMAADRWVLRRTLTKGLEGLVEFGREIVGYEEREGGVVARFADGAVVEGCLLVGADGAGSGISKQLLQRREHLDTGGRWIWGKTNITPELQATFPKEAMRGMSLVQDHSHELPLTLFMEAMYFRANEFRAELPRDYVYWVLMSRVDRPGMVDDAALLDSSPEGVAALSRTLTAGWDPSFKSLFALQNVDQNSILRIATSAPEIPSWRSSEGRVTLVGDAAHLMSPTSASGATTALRDAEMLARVIGEDGIGLGSVGRYEEAMREYAEGAIRWSLAPGNLLFGMRPFEELKPV